jgi:hypothetical protein
MRLEERGNLLVDHLGWRRVATRSQAQSIQKSQTGSGGRGS